jgi:hypothetical protein
MLNKNPITIAITPYSPKIRIQIKSNKDEGYPNSERIPFWFEDIENLEEMTDELNKILLHCREQNVNVLVLPELTVNRQLLTHIQTWLNSNNKPYVVSHEKGIFLVVAGSFHLKLDDGKIVNRSHVLSYSGEELWHHDKMQAFQITSLDVKDNLNLKEKLKIDDRGGQEAIDLMDQLEFLDLPIGRISVCICLDYISDSHYHAMFQSGINVFFVPAMSPTTLQFQDKAKQFGGNHVSTFVSNSSCFVKDDKNGASFYYIPVASKKTCFTFHDPRAIITSFRFSL